MVRKRSRMDHKTSQEIEKFFFCTFVKFSKLEHAFIGSGAKIGSGVKMGSIRKPM
jgi:hypothetical protein